MIKKRCKRCGSYLEGECIGTIDICFNISKFAQNCYCDEFGASYSGCDYGDYSCN